MNARWRCAARADRAGPWRLARSPVRTTSTCGQGTANVYCIVEPKAGRHLTHATRDRKAPRFVAALQRIARRYRTAKTIHLIMDNLNLHGPGAPISTLGADAGGRPLGAVYAALHAQARQLVEPGRDRSQSLVSRVSWPGSCRHVRSPPRSHARLDRARRPRETEDHLAIHDRQGAARLPLQTAEHYVAVEALVRATWRGHAVHQFAYCVGTRRFSSSVQFCTTMRER